MRKTKEVLRLKFELGLGLREIARSCCLGLGTVHEYLQRTKAAGIGWPLPEGWDEEKLEAALFGGAQLLCSHVDPKAPLQSCTFSWALATAANQTQVVSGSFLLAPGASNVQVYQGAGFIHAMSGPIVLCQGRRRAP